MIVVDGHILTLTEGGDPGLVLPKDELRQVIVLLLITALLLALAWWVPQAVQNNEAPRGQLVEQPSPLSRLSISYSNIHPYSSSQGVVVYASD